MLARMAAVRKGLDEGDPLVTVASAGVAGALVCLALSRYGGGGRGGGGRGLHSFACQLNLSCF